ncbi:MAG: hypothetical protein OXG37_09415 [Actinomycetia bacterium]|nr:hypothetical protein [Actinomycetes bacterium]
MNAIEVKAREKAYQKGDRALAGFSLSVPGGKVFRLLGPDDLGKLTTVRSSRY